MRSIISSRRSASPAPYLYEDLLQAGGDERAGEAQDDAALGVAEHHVVDGGGAGGVTRGVGHVGHRVHQRDDVVGGDIDVLDGGDEEFLFSRHGNL
jgi:hypothetical protein